MHDGLAPGLGTADRLMPFATAACIRTKLVILLPRRAVRPFHLQLPRCRWQQPHAHLHHRPPVLCVRLLHRHRQLLRRAAELKVLLQGCRHQQVWLVPRGLHYSVRLHLRGAVGRPLVPGGCSAPSSEAHRVDTPVFSMVAHVTQTSVLLQPSPPPRPPPAPPLTLCKQLRTACQLPPLHARTQSWRAKQPTLTRMRPALRLAPGERHGPLLGHL